MFWILDFAINAAIVPMRALMTDLNPEYMHPFGNSCFAMHLGFGQMLGYGLGVKCYRVYNDNREPYCTGACDLTSISFLESFSSQFSALYTITAGVVVLTTIISCVGCPETQNPYTDKQKGGRLIVLREIYQLAVNLPTPIVRAFIVQSAAYLGWFFLFIYGRYVLNFAATYLWRIFYGY
jgi:hypothetical protein